jgi:ribonuclease-3
LHLWLLAKKVGLDKLVDPNFKKTNFGYKSIYGDMMEAFIGAVYLDKGYRFCKRFIENKLLLPHYDLEEIINSTTNYKSVLIEWSQKENKEVCFEIIDVKQNRKAKEFIAQVTIDSVPIAQGAGLNKKKAEQNAAYKTCKALDLE